MEHENKNKSEVNLEVFVTANNELNVVDNSTDVKEEKNNEKLSDTTSSQFSASSNGATKSAVVTKDIKKDYVPNLKFRSYKQKQKRFCRFCAQGIYYIDYKDEKELKKYLNQYSKIMPRHYTGCCNKHQSYLTNAIKRARIMGLLPFVGE